MTGVAWRWRTALWFVAGCHYWHGIRFKWVRLESNFSSLSSFPSPRPRPRRPERRSMEASHLHSKSPRCSIPFLIIVCEIAPSVLVICSVQCPTFCAAAAAARRVSHALAHRIGRLRNESDWCRPRVWSGRWPRPTGRVRPSVPPVPSVDNAISTAGSQGIYNESMYR